MSTSVMEVILLNQESFQKENASGDESRTPGDGLWKGSSRPYSTPGETFRSWPRTDRSGDPFLLPHAWRHSRPMSEWVSECGKWAINEVGELNFYYKEKSVRFNISRILRVAASSPTTKQKRLRGGGVEETRRLYQGLPQHRSILLFSVEFFDYFKPQCKLKSKMRLSLLFNIHMSANSVQMV